MNLQRVIVDIEVTLGGGISAKGNGEYDLGNGCSGRADTLILEGNDYDAGMGGGKSEGSTTTTTSKKTTTGNNVASIVYDDTGFSTGTKTTYTDGSTRTEYVSTVNTNNRYVTVTNGEGGGSIDGGDYDKKKTSSTDTGSLTTYEKDGVTVKVEKEYVAEDGSTVKYTTNPTQPSDPNNPDDPDNPTGGCADAASCFGNYLEEGIKYKGATSDEDGFHLVVTDKDGKEITVDFTDSGTKKIVQKIENEDGTVKYKESVITVRKEIDERSYFLGYDWHIENLDDRSSDLYGGGKSFTTPMPKATKGGRDKGGLYSVGKGVFKYTLNHFGNHTVTVTPWFDVDRYEVWYTESCNDPGGCTTTRHERYLDSRLESRDPKVYSVPVPLICDGCDGFKFCVGDGCADDCLNTIDLLCDEENAPEYIIENHTQLVR